MPNSGKGGTDQARPPPAPGHSPLDTRPSVRILLSRGPKPQNTFMAAKLTIGFLGAGKMATALARGFLRAGLVGAEAISASDPSEEARAAFARETGARTCGRNADVVAAAWVLVLAVKPDQVAGVLAEIGSLLTDKHLVLSIAAGVPLARLEAGLGPGARVVRVMPNTPALVGAAFWPNRSCPRSAWPFPLKSTCWMR